jgi:thymidylate synthase (FAD)
MVSYALFVWWSSITIYLYSNRGEDMKVELIHYTPLLVCSRAIRRCWASEGKSDNGGEKDKELIYRIGNKFKHESVKNHINYVFDIKGITTKTLLALTRHDIGVEFSVQSTRYTTKSSVKSGTAGYTYSKNNTITKYLKEINMMIQEAVKQNIDNDEISLLLPQAWHYNLICTMSMTALQHFLKLRLDYNHAHWDIVNLAELIALEIPHDHKYLFADSISEKCRDEFKKVFIEECVHD